MSARRLPHTRASVNVADRREETPAPPCTEVPWLFDAVLDKTTGVDHRRAVLAARIVCNECTIAIKRACLAEFRDHPSVIAGLSYEERMGIVRPPQPVTPYAERQAVASCGTESGYSKHRRKGEPMCEPCRDAHRAGERRRAAARAARKEAVA